MDNKERLRKWLWLGLDETTAKKYQRKISAENVRIVRNESVAIAGIGALYTICMLALSRVYGKSVICIIGAILMFCIFLYTQNLVKKQDEISKKEARISISSFMICAYDVMDGILAAVIGNFAAFERAKIKWESVKVHEQLEEERDVDMLTGIWNRRAFEREVDYLINSGTIKNMVVIMVDLDKFKRINDGYGHETGDAYLKHFCNLISEYTEKNTIVGRRSGDEFFIFSYNFRELSQVEHNVAAFYEKLAKNPILLPDGTEKVIGVSSGVVWTVDMNHDWREILCAADESLYYVKEHGRNSYTIQEYIPK